MMGEICSVCNRDDYLFRLYKCPICFQRVCEKCALRRMGRVFCATACATEFFYFYDDNPEASQTQKQSASPKRDPHL